MKIKTLNSVYEVDTDRQMIRRLSGLNPPTGHFEEDGKWQKYAALGPVEVGTCVWVHWTWSEFTRLSITQEIENETKDGECQSKISSDNPLKPVAL